MRNIILGTVLAVAYPVLYWFLGGLLPKRYQSGSVPVMCMTGFLVYYALFEVIALPMKIMRQPLSHLTIIWGIVLLVLGAFILLRRREVLSDSIKNISDGKSKWVLLMILAVMSVGIAVLLGYNTNPISDYDAAYYIGLSASSTSSNTLELMSPLDGRMLDVPQKFYLLNTDTLHSSIVFQVLNLHPLVERKWSFTIAMTLLFEMTLYQCAREFFKKEYARIGVFCALANAVLFFSYGIAGVSQYFAYRTYEGKSIVSYLYMSMIFCFALALYKKEKGRWPWAGLFLCAASSIAFCNTALFVVPVMIASLLLPYAAEKIFRKQWKTLAAYVLVLLPCVFWVVLYKLL